MRKGPLKRLGSMSRGKKSNEEHPLQRMNEKEQHQAVEEKDKYGNVNARTR